MIIVSWNINSVRIRLHHLKRLIDEVNPDVVCLQETKVVTESFPYNAISDLGFPYQAAVGIKSYNGVAILSKYELSKTEVRNWCEKEDARHIFSTINSPDMGEVEVHNLYVPAGGDIPDIEKNDKFAHKLRFLNEVSKWQESRSGTPTKQILLGDLNIAPLESDVWSHKQLMNIVSHTDMEITALKNLQNAGPWIDAVRELVPKDKKLFSWWSYRAKDWTTSNRGRRLDHVWVTKNMRNSIKKVQLLKEARSWEKPSDHAPLIVTFKASK